MALALPINAAAAGDAGQPGAYLRAGAGARALGMGNAFVAVDSQAEAAWWNPAGLALLKGPSLASSVASLSLGRRKSDAALSYPAGKQRAKAWGSWGLSWLHFSLGDDFEGRSADTAAFTTFSDQQNAYALSHGRMAASWLALGAGIKAYDRRLGSFSASGAGADFGLLLMPHPLFKMGVALQDLFSENRWTTGYSESYPITTRIGLGGEFWKERLLISLQGSAVEGRQVQYAAGLEGRLAGALALRAGIRDQGFTLGGGASLDALGMRLSLDYAFSKEGLGLGDIQLFSISIVFL